MKTGFRIAQITDCHVSAEPDTLYRGQNPLKNLQLVLDHVAEMKPDVLLATGDLSEDGTVASYEALAKMLEQPGVPVLALPGNHDDPALLEHYFPGSPVHGVTVTRHAKWRIIRLDSCLSGKPHGRFDDEVLQRLKEILVETSGQPRLVALHHQPLLANSPWIDKFRLMDAGPFVDLRSGASASGVELYEFMPYPAIKEELIRRYPRIAENNPIFALHAKSMVIDNHIVYIGTFNLDPRSANLNTEVGLLVDSPELARQLTASIERDIGPGNSWQSRLDSNPDVVVGRWTRFKSWFNRMLPLEPVL